jgi:hypothetical protein
LNTSGINGGTDVYLTSYDDVTTNPKWLEGIKLDANGGTGNEKTAVIVVVDKGDLEWSRKKEGKVVDVFYFYFWSFNWGGVVLGNQLGTCTIPIISSLCSVATLFEFVAQDANRCMTGDHVGDW